MAFSSLVTKEQPKCIYHHLTWKLVREETSLGKGSSVCSVSFYSFDGGVLWVWVQFLCYWNRNEAEEIRERSLSVWLTGHTKDTLVKTEDARLPILQFSSYNWSLQRKDRKWTHRQQTKKKCAVYDQKEYSEDPTPRTRDSKLPDIRGEHFTFHPCSSVIP